MVKKNTKWVMRHPFAQINEEYCKIYNETCHWSEDCHCYNQKFCIRRQERIPNDKLKEFKQAHSPFP